MTDPKKLQESIDFPILRIVDEHLQAGGRIEKRHGRICLVNSEDEYIIGGTTTKEMLENLILLTY